MRFTSIRLRNWRNFADTGTVALAPRTFLVGPNASGKSNLLDALRFLQDIARSGLAAAVNRHGGLGAIKSLYAHGPQAASIEVEVDLGEGERPWGYALELGPGTDGRCRIARETIRHGQSPRLDRPDANDRSDPELLTQTHLEQVAVNREYRPLVEFLRSVQYRHIVPQIVREPEKPQNGEDDPFGRFFIETVGATEPELRDARFRRVESALRTAVPRLADLGLVRDTAGRWHLRASFHNWRPFPSGQTEERFSDGTLRLLALLWSLLEGGGPLLLEEPELSLHTEVVRRLPALFAEVSHYADHPRQLLVSTHSSEILSDEGIGPEELVLLVPGERGTDVFCGADRDDVRQALEAGLTAAEATAPLTAPQLAGQPLLGL